MNFLKLFKFLLSLSFISCAFFLQAQEGGDDAAAASATGSAAAPAKGAPKAAQANSKLRTLHIAIHKLGLSHEQILAHGGIEDLHNTYKEILADPTHGGFAGFAKHGDLVIGDGHDLADAAIYGEFLRDPDNAGKSKEDALLAAKSAHADAYGDSASAELLLGNARDHVISLYNSPYVYADALSSAFAIAGKMLTDVSITDSDISGLYSISVASLSDGHNLELIRLLSAYGAIGGSKTKGESLASKVLESSSYSAYNSGATLSSILTGKSSKDYLTFLSDLTGSRGFDDDDAASLGVLDIPLANVTLVPSSMLSIGTAGSVTTIDVTDQLKDSSSNNRKVLILGAAKDLKVAGNVKITNANDAEDHALVLGAADDVMIDGSDIEYTGSNLAIGAGGTDADSMYLVNTTISTGGNLAAGSLGNLNITNANFNVGLANSATSDPDNIYLYANEMIVVDNMNTSGGRVDDIYMESKTIHIKNTTFPATAEVMLRSRAGSLHVQANSSDIQAGGVNFYNVKHLRHSNNFLDREDFSGANGHINSTATLPNGTPAIRIRAQ